MTAGSSALDPMARAIALRRRVSVALVRAGSAPSLADADNRDNRRLYACNAYNYKDLSPPTFRRLHVDNLQPKYRGCAPHVLAWWVHRMVWEKRDGVWRGEWEWEEYDRWRKQAIRRRNMYPSLIATQAPWHDIPQEILLNMALYSQEVRVH